MLWVPMIVAAGVGCVSPDGTGDATPVDRSGSLVVAATAADDYSAGGLAIAAPDGDVLEDVTSLHGDAVVQVVDDAVVALNRLGADTVRWYDALGAAPRWEVSTGEASNPHAVARVGDRLLVTRYEAAEVQILAVDDGALVGTLDLSDEADADGVPEASGVAVDGDVVLVALQRLDRDDGWTAAPKGRVAIVRLLPPTLVDVVEVGPNPRLVAHPDGGALVAADDGIWRVRAGEDPVGPLRPEGLDGVIGSLSVAGDGRVVAVTRDCDDCTEHTAVCLDAWDGDVTGASEAIAAYVADALAVGDRAWLAVRRGWQDPEDTPGGLTSVPLGTCGPVPPSDAWVRGTFAPFSLAWRPAVR